MTYRLILPVEDNKVVVTLPPDFKGRKEVAVFIDDEVCTRSQKFEELKLAMTNPLLLSDIAEVHQEFDAIDS
ncbi:MAG: hypothetical protein L6Q78_01295 [Bacteroidia bacterium]|nr:hypothetical protein [Bacteroidia bacterium]